MEFKLSNRVIAPKEAAYMLGVSRSTLWVLASDKGFPDRVQITERRFGWMEADLLKFIEDKKLTGATNSF